MATAFGKATRGTFEAPDLEDNYYRVQVVDVKDSVNTYGGANDPQFNVKLELLDEQKDDGGEIYVTAFLRVPEGVIKDGTLNENSKLYEFLIALGYTDEDLEIEPDDWQAKQLRIQWKNGEVKEGPNKGQWRGKVVGFAPLKQSKPAAAAGARRATKPAKPETSEEDDF